MKQFVSAITTCLLFSLSAYSNTQIITVQNHVFTPSSFTIHLGDTIEWKWINGSHTTTSLGIPAGAVSWDHSINSGSQIFVYIPSKTGTYNYKCTPHQSIGMTGSFTVQAACAPATAEISAASGTTFCKGGSVLLNSSVSANITSYIWKKDGTIISGATASKYTATTTGSYSLMVTNNCGNSAVSNVIKVSVNNPPKATITPSGTVNICPGDSIKLQANTGTGLTYQWTKNGANINGATASGFTAKQGGNYRVIVTKKSTACSKQSAITKVVRQCPGVTKNNFPDAGAIKVFPNPSSGDFHILLPSYNNEEFSLLIFDENGTMKEKSKINAKDFSFGSGLKPGIYLIQLKKENTVIHEQKISKE